MAIRPHVTLSRSDLQSALDHVGASVSSLARDSGVPRYNLSLLRSKGVPLSKAHDVALRQYLADQGVNTADAPADANLHSPLPVAEKIVRCCWPLPDTVSDDDVQGVLGMIEDNDNRLAELLRQPASMSTGFLGLDEPGFTQETRTALQEVFTLCAESYVLLRTLRGWRAFDVSASPDTVQTLRGTLLDTFRQRLEEAGLIETAPVELSDEESTQS